MKKTKLIYLFPAAALLLSGCTFQEGWDATKTWISDHIVSPISSLFGGKKKQEKSSDSATPADSSTTPTDGSTTPTDGGTTPTETTTEVSFTLSSASSVTKSGVTVTFAKGNGSNDPAWYDNGLRLYAKNTLTFSSETDIKKVEFDWEKQGSKAFATVTANTGSYTHPSSAGKGTWTGSSKSIVFTLGDATAQLQLNTFKVTIVGSGGGGGGGGQTAAEFPSSTINTYTESLGSSIHLPEFSGTALSYEFDSEYGSLDIEVGQGNEATAVSTYQNDLLGSNNFVEGSVDQYGDMHYISSDNILDVCVWDGNDAATAAPGHVYVDILEYVEPSDTLPTSQINEFLTENEFGFTISASVETALNALSDSFVVTEDVYQGYPIMLVQLVGSVVEGVKTALNSTLVGAGYTLSTETDEGEYYYSNSDYMGVYIYSENGITVIQLY